MNTQKQKSPDLGRFKDVVLRGQDVNLRPFTLDDVTEKYQAWLLDEETVKYLDVGFADRSLPALRNWAKGVISDQNRFFFMIVHRENQNEIGTCNLQIDQTHRHSNYGYLIGDKEWWGTGIPLQAQVVLFDFAFDVLGNRRFYAGVRSDNVMSQFNLRRLGFKKEGIFRQHVCVNPDQEEYSDAVYYGLMAEEWAEECDRFDELRHPDELKARQSSAS